jgi:hypothetical protein
LSLLGLSLTSPNLGNGKIDSPEEFLSLIIIICFGLLSTEILFPSTLVVKGSNLPQSPFEDTDSGYLSIILILS